MATVNISRALALKFRQMLEAEHGTDNGPIEKAYSKTAALWRELKAAMALGPRGPRGPRVTFVPSQEDDTPSEASPSPSQEETPSSSAEEETPKPNPRRRR